MIYICIDAWSSAHCFLGGHGSQKTTLTSDTSCKFIMGGDFFTYVSVFLKYYIILLFFFNLTTQVV